MASKMELEPESPSKADSPLSYDVEKGELSSGSGRSSPATIRDNASECSTQTYDQFDNSHPHDTVTTMRVEVDNTTNEQYTLTALNQLTPQDIARIIAEKSVRPKTTDVRKNIESSRTWKNNNVAEPSTSTCTHSYQNNRPQNRQQNSNSNPSETHISPPLPNYPPPLTPRSNNRKSFFHQSTNEQTPTATVMETI